MAFLRWRARCAQLLATIYVDGRSKKITLISLPGFFISEAEKQQVANKFPGIKVDWLAIARSLAEGPPKLLKTKPPKEHFTIAEVEHHLRKWAETAPAAKDAYHLRAAASVLLDWRARFYQDNEIESKPNMGQFQNR
jgi:hypothetical protein